MCPDVVQEFTILYVSQGGGKVTTVSLGKQDDQHLFKTVHNGTHLYTQDWRQESRDRQILGAHWPAIIANQLNTGLSRNPATKQTQPTKQTNKQTKKQ